ncbi:MAG: TonB-dependent receptor [Saonia sp.]
MKSPLLFTTIFLITILSTFAQTGSISGKITDISGNALPSVNVSVQGTTLGSSTDATGAYAIANVPIGQQTVSVSYVGYEPMKSTVTVSEGIDIEINFELLQTSESLSEVVVTGKRETGYVATEQSGATFGSRDLVDIPLSVSVITQEVLIDQQVRSLGDLVRNDPSVIVTNPPGFNETVNVRGFVLDNSTSYRRENLIFQNQVQSPFENKAAVEIIKGPAAIRYGFTPPGGVVNYVLKRPTENPYAFVQTFGDSNGSYGVHGDFGGKLNEKFGYRINALVANEASFVNNVAGPRQLFSALFEWRPIENLRIDIEGEYQYRELEQQAVININSFDESLSTEQIQSIIENVDPKTFLGQEWGYYPTRNFVGSLGFQYDFDKDWNVQGRIQEMNLIRDQRNAAIQPGSIQANGDFEQTAIFSASQVRKPLSAELFIDGSFTTFGIEHEIAVGGAYSRNPLGFALNGDFVFDIGPSNLFNPVTIEQPVVFDDIAVDDALVFTQKAVYVTDFIKLSEKFELLAALRYTEQRNEDVFNDEGTLQTSYQDDIIVPNLGLIYSPTEKINLYASYSTGVTNGEQIPNEAANFGEDVFLDPVETEQFEIGLKAEVFQKALLTAAYFDIDQPLAFLDNNNLYRYAGSQRHRGAELTLSGRVSDNARVIVGGLFLDPSIDNLEDDELDGNVPAGVPEFQANIFADYQLPFAKGLDVNGGLFFTGDRFADNLNTFSVDGYARLDLGARYGFRWNKAKMTARLNVRNVTNTQFVEGTAFGSLAFGAPTTAIFSLAAEF